MGRSSKKRSAKSAILARRSRPTAARPPRATRGGPAGSVFMRLVIGGARFWKTAGRSVSLPRQVGTQKLIEANAGATPQVRGSAWLTVGSAARQEVVRDVAQLSETENKSLAELFAKGRS